MDKQEWQNKSIFTAPAHDFGPTKSAEHDVIGMGKHIAALETENAELKTACGLKDGAILKLYAALIDNFCHEDSCPFLRDNPERCDTCSAMPARMVAVKALSSTPEAVKREAEDARGCKVVEEWCRASLRALENAHYPGRKLTRSAISRRACLRSLERVIAQAKEGASRA